MGKTFHDRFEETNRRSSGFDYLRLILAIGIVFFHSVFICHPKSYWIFGSPLRPLAYYLVPSFFALSGFLVAGSLERHALPTFFSLRALRLLPALAVEVLISAIIIGSLFTTWTWRDYFTDPMFWSYFGNMVGDIHYTLPGVFNDLPLASNVNGQLWTVPYELKCYLVIGALGMVGLAMRGGWLFAIATVATVYLTVKHNFGLAFPRLAVVPGSILITSCLYALWLYAARRSIPYSWPLFILSIAASAALLYSTDYMYLAALPIAYSTVFMGLLNPPKISLVSRGDYSYGLYLYSFPIQQSLSSLLANHRYWLVNALLGLVIGGLCAAMSWHLVESRALAQRKRITGWTGRFEQAVARWSAAHPIRQTAIFKSFAAVLPKMSAFSLSLSALLAKMWSTGWSSHG